MVYSCSNGHGDCRSMLRRAMSWSASLTSSQVEQAQGKKRKLLWEAYEKN